MVALLVTKSPFHLSRSKRIEADRAAGLIIDVDPVEVSEEEVLASTKALLAGSQLRPSLVPGN